MRNGDSGKDGEGVARNPGHAQLKGDCVLTCFKTV